MRKYKNPIAAAVFPIVLVILLLDGRVALAGQDRGNTAAPASSVPKIELKDILQNMADHNRRREQSLHNYAVARVYQVENKRINKSATVQATMIFVAPDSKEFEVRSAEGSVFMRKGVLNRIIETEQKSASQPSKNAISPENYEFEFLGQETRNDRPQFILRAKARHKDRLLFDGTIWVDAEDFAVTRIEGHPAKNPSFWTRKVDFIHEYQKFDSFWFPVRNESITQVFIFGKTTTAVDYSHYQINRPELPDRAAEIRKRGNHLEIQIDAKDKTKSPTSTNPEE